jgi:hypothetical protein
MAVATWQWLGGSGWVAVGVIGGCGVSQWQWLHGSGVVGKSVARRIDWYYLQPVDRVIMGVNGCGRCGSGCVAVNTMGGLLFQRVAVVEWLWCRWKERGKADRLVLFAARGS